MPRKIDFVQTSMQILFYFFFFVANIIFIFWNFIINIIRDSVHQNVRSHGIHHSKAYT